MYARLVDGQPVETRLADVIEDMGGRANVSLPSPLTDEALANLGLYRIRPGTRPEETDTRKPVATGLALVNGEVTREWTLQDKPLADAKAAMRAKVSDMTRKKQEAGAPTPEGVCDSDMNSRNKLNGAVLMAMLSAQARQPFAITWTMADNSNVSLDGPRMIAMASAVGSYVAACHAQGQALKDAIEAAADHDELDSIDIEAGWP